MKSDYLQKHLLGVLIGAIFFTAAPHGLAQTKVIANWDMVPYQVFNSVIKVGVVGFHETGVHVEFKVNGAALATVDEPTYNPDVRVYEYWVELNASNYSDGPVTVSAVAYPDSADHLSRPLDDLTLYANAGGSLTNNTVKWADCTLGSDTTGDGSEANPYKTLEQAYMAVGDGGTVYLKRGDCYQITTYSRYPAGYTHWTTITAAPGVAREEVLIGGYKAGNGSNESGRFGENFVHWKNVTLYGDNDPGYGTVLYFENTHKIWLDGVQMYDARGRFNGTIPYGGNAGYEAFITDALLRDFSNAGGQFMRNVDIRTICSDIYRPDDGMVGINVSVDGIDPGPTEAHPDFLQFYNPGKIVENVIVYNNKGINLLAQGLFGQNARDVAFVNLLLEKDPPESFAISQYGEVWDHILLWHVTTVDSGMIFRGEMSDKRNWNVQNNLLACLDAGPDTTIQSSVIDHNHYAGLVWDQTNGPMGTNATVGEPKFLSVETDDYRITPDSPAYHTGVPLPGVPADLNGYLYDPVTPSLGAFEYGSEPNYTPPRSDDPSFIYKLTSKLIRGKRRALRCTLTVNRIPAAGRRVTVQRRNAKDRRYKAFRTLATDGQGQIKARKIVAGSRYRCAYSAPSGGVVYSKALLVRR